MRSVKSCETFTPHTTRTAEGQAKSTLPTMLGAPVPAETFQVPLTVQEPSGIARRPAPVSGGVPLPKGRFKVSQPFALFRETGEELPCQVNPLVVETDGITLVVKPE